MTDRLSTKASRTRLQHFTILVCSFLGMVFLLSACEGFMDGGDVRQRIIQKREYAEAPSYKINKNIPEILE